MYLTELAQQGIECNGAVSSIGSSYGKLWTIAPRAEELCKAIVARLGDGRRKYLGWVLGVIEELDGAK